MMMILLSKVQVNIVWAQSFLKKLLLLGVRRLKSAIELGKRVKGLLWLLNWSVQQLEVFLLLVGRV